MASFESDEGRYFNGCNRRTLIGTAVRTIRPAGCGFLTGRADAEGIGSTRKIRSTMKISSMHQLMERPYRRGFGELMRKYASAARRNQRSSR